MFIYAGKEGWYTYQGWEQKHRVKEEEEYMNEALFIKF
jgi:hypothetical protein